MVTGIPPWFLRSPYAAVDDRRRDAAARKHIRTIRRVSERERGEAERRAHFSTLAASPAERDQFAGRRRVSSSVQFCTTTMPDGDVSAATFCWIMTKRPSRAT